MATTSLNTINNDSNTSDNYQTETMLPVHGLHALAYCERLFYLENVENLRLADAAVFAGRRLHAQIEKEEDGDEWVTLTLQNQDLGLIGKVDCMRKRDGKLIPYEHKKGYSASNSRANASASAWPSDRLQIIAYTVLVELHTKQSIPEARIRYHADNVMVRVPIDEMAREDLTRAIFRARELQKSIERPPVTTNEKLCVRCSLAPICLPEEARLPNKLLDQQTHKPLRLFPADDDRQSLHVITPKSTKIW